MWILLSLFFAIWASIGFVIVKKLVRSLDSIVVLFLSLVFALPFMIILLLLTTGFPKINPYFFLAIGIAAILDVVAMSASYKAIKLSPLSEISPISSFTPVFALIFAVIFLREIPTPMRLLGVIIVVIGAYVLNIAEIKKGFFEPVKKLAYNKGVQLFFLTNFLWSITPIFQKIAIQNTSPLTPLVGPLVDYALVIIILSPVVFKKLYQSKETVRNVKKSFWIFILIGIFGTLSQYAAYTAFSLTNPGYALSVFRLSAIFTIILAYFFLKEKNIGEKLLGAVIMIIGVILIVI
jgi:drug/metabolite transporter (DMT)-like permease